MAESAPSSLTYIRLEGAAFRTVFDELAALRMAVFYDFPYLYEGSMAYEKTYLETYAISERSFLFAVYDGKQMVGATTAIPLSDEMPEVQEPFIKAEYDRDAVFYFGESVLLPAYRGLGIGNQFFDEREAHARKFVQCTMTCFCAVQRPEDHPLRPADYRPLDEFWQKRGYQRDRSLQGEMIWPDRNETVETAKTMIYWTKKQVVKKA
ncbi:GNAT family N-acetyltransferase [Spirosoma pulveris]